MISYRPDNNPISEYKLIFSLDEIDSLVKDKILDRKISPNILVSFFQLIVKYSGFNLVYDRTNFDR